MALAADNKGYQSSPSIARVPYANTFVNYENDDGVESQYAEIQPDLTDTVPRARPQNPMHRPLSGLKRLIIALFACVIICMVLSAAAVGISLANLYKPLEEAASWVEVTAPLPSILAECQGAVNFTSSWRLDHDGRAIRPRNDLENCDTIRLNMAGRPWFRFTGDAGNRLLDTCPSSDGSCGTHGAMWSDNEPPVEVGKPQAMSVYGSWTGNCKEFTYVISVMRCSNMPHDFIYKYSGDDSCSRGFCGMF